MWQRKKCKETENKSEYLVYHFWAVNRKFPHSFEMKETDIMLFCCMDFMQSTSEYTFTLSNKIVSKEMDYITEIRNVRLNDEMMKKKCNNVRKKINREKKPGDK